MNTSFARGMSRAAELTRAGKLDEATALIRALVQGTSLSDTHPPETGGQLPDGDVIEGSAIRLDTHGISPKARSKGLGAALRGIAAGGMPAWQGKRAPLPVDLPEGARFLALKHLGRHGSRDYRLYVPARRPEGRMPLIVMLHGCTQSAEDFAIGTGMNTLAEEFGFLVAWPEQPQGANAQKCWNWFRPEDQGRDRGEPAVLAGVVRDILRDHPADASRVYIAGLSAGGAAAAIMGAAYPEIFAAVGVHSGLPVGGARDVPSAFSAMRSGATGATNPVAVPTIVFHGLADATVHPGNGAAVLKQALATRADLRKINGAGQSKGGRVYRHTRHADDSGLGIAEHWEIEGAGHAWSGGNAGGSHTDPKGPDASREMVRFFLAHRQK